MSSLSPARRAALALVSERRRRDGRIRDIARGSDALAGLSPEDRALAMRLSVGAVAASVQVDGIIDAYVSRPSSLEPRVRDALEVSVFEICYLDTPSAVAVSQGVELVRRASARAAGMANAVLRKVATEVRPKVDAAWARCEDGSFDEDDLAQVSSLPSWLVSRVVDEAGRDAACAMAMANLEQAPVFVAANELRHTPDELRSILESRGLGPREAGLPGAFVLDAPQGLSTSGLVEDCDLVVADLSAQRACLAAAPKPGMHVLEIGQGRGTKSILLQSLALRAGGPVGLVGIDSVDSKTRIARERMARAGLSDHVECVCADATSLAGQELFREVPGTFDLVFLDAPCSGTGTTRRHPEIAARLTPEGVSELASLQLRLLEAASSRVVSGGRLVYATCSVLAEENGRVVDSFLHGVAGSDFSLADGEGFQSIPSLDGPDGHFCAVMLRS